MQTTNLIFLSRVILSEHTFWRLDGGRCEYIHVRVARTSIHYSKSISLFKNEKSISSKAKKFYEHRRIVYQRETQINPVVVNHNNPSIYKHYNYSSACTFTHKQNIYATWSPATLNDINVNFPLDLLLVLQLSNSTPRVAHRPVVTSTLVTLINHLGKQRNRFGDKLSQ